MPDLSQAIQDRDGNTSSKRLLAFLAFGLFAEGFVASQFGHAPGPDLMVDLLVMILGCIGLTVPEWLSKRTP